MLVSWAAVLGVALVELGMALTPGPNMVHLAARSIGQGTRAGLVALAGTAVGFVVYLVASSFGLAALFAAVPAAFTVVKIAGAVYLGYLAWQMLRPGGHSVFDPAEVTTIRPLRLFGMGLVTNLLNPKIALLYAAILPQFIDPTLPVWPQFLVLGAVQTVIGVAVNCLVVVSAGRLAGFLRARPLAMRLQRVLSGTVLGAFAVKLAFERQPST
ncbi:LysE family translocator [Agromyces bauzanensis]